MDTPGSLRLLPPPADHCQECAVKHDPRQAHDATSLFYHVWFHQKNGRYPNWADATAHCSEEIRRAWTNALAERGITMDGPVRGQKASPG